MTIAGRFSPMGGIPDRVFKATFVIPADGLTLDFQFTYATFSNPIDVDWGDGSKETLTGGTGSNNLTYTHTYSSAGSYQITLRSGDGKIPKIRCYGQTKIKSVDESHVTWTMGTNIATTFEAMFRGSTVESVPKTLFIYNPNATNFSGVFYSATKFLGLPDDLFIENKKVTNFASVNYNCNKVTAIPPKIFAYHPSVTTFQSAFHSCAKLASIPAGLFDACPNVTNFLSVFRSDPLLTEIPQDLFKYQIKVTNFSYAFYSCTGLTCSLQADLLSSSASTVTNLSYTFAGCKAMTGNIPEGFLDGFTKLENLTQTFFNCQLLTSAPSLLFKDCAAATNFTQCFASCVKMTIPSDLFCASTAKTTRFANVTPNFDRCFNRTSWSGSVAGTAPDLWNYTFGGSPTTTNCYGGAGNSASSLTNYSSIPSAWKS